jgi:hypothetical protein
MPSSTSSSEPAERPASRPWRDRTAVVLLGALVLVAIAAAEIGFRWAIRQSRIERRTDQEQRAVEQVRRSARTREVLILGNSLLLAGVNFEDLSSELQPSWHATRFVVEQTSYYDWYYGTRLLLDRGSRPDAIGLALESLDLVSNGARGEYFAYRLLLTRDALAATHDLRLHPTEAASYLLGTVSCFYGVRSEVRKVLLGRLVPNLAPLVMRLVDRPAPKLEPETLHRIARERLLRFRDLLAPYGIRLVVVLMPVPGRTNQIEPIRRAGREAGVPVVAPYDERDFAPELFSDGYHLSQDGARKLTGLVGPSLRQALAER